MRPPVGIVRRLVLKARFTVGSARVALRGKLAPHRPTVELAQVQRRLELLLTAMYGRPIPIASTASAKRNWLVRTATLIDRDPRSRESMPSVDVESIHLPESLDAREGVEVAIRRFRLLAVEQAERLTRGTVVHAPHDDPMVHDLYALREGMTVDARLARVLPGMHAALADERREALARRPKLERLTARERDVELLLRDALSSDLGAADESALSPEASLAWAKDTAARLHGDAGAYRGLPPTSLWGTIARTELGMRDAQPNTNQPMPPPSSIAPPIGPSGLRRAPSPQSPPEENGDQSAPSPDTAEVREGPEGESNAEWPEADPKATLDADRLEQAKLHNIPSGSSALLGDNRQTLVDEDELNGLPPGLLYDEWDSTTMRYLTNAATVRLYDSPDADEGWSTDVLHRHAAIVRQVRHQFERLRARRTLLGRQRSGDDIDLASCVNAIVDRRIGRAPDERLYMDARPARRGLAISLLVDISGSTETRVTTALRVLDIERIAVLLAGEALDALGDLYAINAFAGKNATNVKLIPIKTFAERNGAMVRRRVAGLEPGGFTRLGAAVRFATRQLAWQTAGHRLLLILSDGRPHDIDRYSGPYGVEDSRQAIMEARASGVFPFCLTVDHEASEYLPRIFGTAGHTVLQRAEQLPTALLGVVKALIRKP